ncbi:hypothetical protein [Pontibacter populi]|uniref:DUF4595 domain-containing protein n=1 Tax=Pontibacter populi TaxID=890055 RepID=A0ABV1RNQ7_9BACT
MKTLLASVLLALFILTGCSKSDDPTPLPKIKSVTSYLHQYNGEGKLVDNWRVIWSKEVYDADGLLLKKQYRKSYVMSDINNPLFTENNTYENKLLIKKEVLRSDYPTYNSYNNYLYANGRQSGYDYYFLYNGSYDVLDKYRYEYTTDEQPSKMLHYEYPFSKEPIVHAYTYDTRGNKIKELITGDSPYKGTYEWEFDAHNNLTRKTFTRPHGSSTIAVSTYTYDAANKITEKLTQHSSTFGDETIIHVTYKNIYHYDKQGLLTTIVVYDSIESYYNGEFTLDSELRYEYEFHN